MSPNQDAPAIERRTRPDRRKALAHYQDMAETARVNRDLADARLLIERLTIDIAERDETIARLQRALLAERDALADALMAIEGLYEYDMPVGEAAMALYEASNIARAALAQEES